MITSLKIIKTGLLALFVIAGHMTALATPRSSATYTITSESFAPGGAASSASYQLSGGSMEPISGASSSATYQAQHGFLVTGGADLNVEVPGGNATPVNEINEDWTENEQEADGSYAGVLKDSNGNVVSSITLKVSFKNGVASGLIVYDGLKLKYKGTIIPNGSLTVTGILDKKSGRIFDLALQLVTTPEGFRIAGSVTEGATVLGASLDQSAFNAKTDPSGFAGLFTVLIPASQAHPDGATHPQGDGWGVMSIATSGKIKFAGQLGDGTKLSLGGIVSKDGTWQIFKELYRTKPKGTFGGTVTFRDIPNVSDFDGNMHWLKREYVKDKLYPAGFEVDVKLIGSNFDRPFPTERVLTQLASGDNNADWMLGMGNLPTNPGTKSVTWTEKNKVSYVRVGTEKFSIKPNVKSGLVSGSYSDKAAGLNVRFAGVAFQKQGIVAGNFRGVDQTGYLFIQPVGGPILQVRSFAGDVRLQNEDITPDLADGTDFGAAGTEGGFADRSFRIRNSGTANLFVLDTPTVTGSQFSVISARTGPLVPGEEMLMTVRFNPTATGPQTATVTIETNAEHANPFTFDIQGNGVAGNFSSHDGALGGWVGTEPGNPADAPATTAVNFDLGQLARYTGLLESQTPGQEIPGLLSVKVGKNGAFSGLLQHNGAKYKIKGILGVAGDATVQITLRTGGTIDIALQAHKADTSEQFRIHGTVTESNSGTISDFALVRNSFHKKTNLAPQAGAYTSIIIGNDDLGIGYPGGDGAVAMSVSTSGTIKAIAILGDQTKLSLSGFLSADNEWQLYRSAYRTKPNGFLAGTLTFRDTPNVSDFDGVLQWRKRPSTREKIYRHGFQQRVKAIGARFTRPLKTERGITSLPDTTDNATFTFENGNLAPILPVPFDFTWNVGDKAVFIPVGTERFKLKISQKNGFVSGSYTDKTTGLKITKMSGVVYQKQEIVSGSFLGSSATGRILVKPKP